MADELTIREADANDVWFFWEVNNDPSVRAQSISTDPIPRTLHEAWYAASLDRPGRAMFVTMFEGQSAGVVRFDIEERTATISVALAPEFRGRGLGTATIRRGCEAMAGRVSEVEAFIRPENFASLVAFERAGFRRTEGTFERDGVVLDRMVWEPNNE